MNGPSDLDDFEKAILLGYAPATNENLKQTAIEYTNKVKNAPDGWLFCLEKLFETKRVEVRFFCLICIQEAILHRFEALTIQQREILKKGFVRWINEYLPANSVDVAIRNKFAQVLVIFFKATYPQEWPTFFTDILSYLHLGPSLIDIFLRIMRSIDEEVVSNEVPRNTTEVAHNVQIKDYMRIQAVKDLTQTWHRILSSYGSVSAEICRDCLDVLRRYIGWIDIGLIANDQFIPLFFKFLVNEQLREQACECIYEIISKGMIDPVAKLALLNKLNLTTVFSSISMDDDSDFLVCVAKIVNTMGTQLIDCISRVSALVAEQKVSPDVLANAAEMLERSLLLMFRFMNNEDDDVSQSVVGFATGYLHTMKNNVDLTPKQNENLSLLLQIIRNKMKYDDSYNFDKQDENEAAFQEYRKELRNLYKLITKINPQIVSTFVIATITAITTTNATLSYYDIEVALSLLYNMGDGLPENTLKTLEGFFGKMMAMLSGSNVSAFPHQAITLMYFDVIVRYARYLPDDVECLKKVLISFFDQRGIRSANATVRSRICYLFQRFAKSQVANLKPFLASILHSLKDFMVISLEVQRIVSFDDQVNLYDAVGCLVASVPEHGIASKEILTPLISQMEEILGKELYKSDTPDKPVYTTFLMQIITVIGTYSKGFVGSQKESTVYFLKALETSVGFLKALPNHEEVRGKVMFYMHRMIDCIGNEVLQFLPPIITQMMTNCGLKDLTEFVRLVNQLMSKFKEQMFPIIDSILLKLIERLFAFSSELVHQPQTNFNEPKTELERELFEVQKTYYLMISTLLSNNLTHVLKSPTNAPHMSQILKTILQGCSEYRDLGVVKQCFIILKKLIEQWAGFDQNAFPGFNKFVYEEITPLLIREVMKPQFLKADPAGANNVLHEIVAIQKLIFQKCGPEFLTYLQAVFLPSLGCHPDLITQYIYNLEKESPKNFKNFFTTFITGFKT